MSLLLVRDLMSEPVFTVGPTSTLRDVIQLMENRDIRHVPVVNEEQRVVGLISQRDFLRSQEASLSGALTHEQADRNRWLEARSLMTKDVRTVSPDTSALDAARALRSCGYGCLPVVEGGKLVGMVTEADFVEYSIRVLSVVSGSHRERS